MRRIELRSISKNFNAFKVLHDVSVTVSSGELVALLGPSGSGKTTLLRIIAGLEVPDEGAVLFDAEEVTHRQSSERRVGFVFQQYALFRHMTVFENVAFGLRVKRRRERLSRLALEAKVDELLRLVQLEPLAQRYPAQLSGGQRQRVALARTLAVQPEILLLDEPFGALDAKVRQELRRWLRRLHDEIGITSVFVTHDQEEALELADRVIVMREGQVEQIGTPEEVYEHPGTPFVYQFLGSVNLFHGRIEGDQVHFGDFTMELSHGSPGETLPAVAYARPHRLEIDQQRAGRPQFRATVAYIHAAGSVVKVELTTAAGASVHVEMSQERYQALRLHRGAQVFVTVKELNVFTNGHHALL